MNQDLFASPSETAPAYTAHCDGGARGNPGPAGFGAVIEDPSGKIVAELSEYLGLKTNNFAEYSGLLAVLRWANENHLEAITVVSDSELMVKQMKGQYKVASPILRPLFEEARKLSRSIKKFEIRHTLRGGNKHADRLANEAMDRGMCKPVGGSKTGGVSNASGVSGVSGASGVSRSASPLAAKPKSERQILEGYVKNGVVHLLGGSLPDGVFVKILYE